MAKQKYSLNCGEEIVYRVSCVNHGFWGAYTNALAITNQSVIFEQYGMLGNFKGIERFYYADIHKAIKGEAFNGEMQLELHIGNAVERFMLQSGDESEMDFLVMAINDQMGPDAEYFDSNYYQNVLDEVRIAELKAKESTASGSELEIATSFAKNLFMSGNFSAKGISKAVKQATRKENLLKDALLDELGIRDIQDEFIEMGNEFREELGLKPKMTFAEKKELEELEAKRQKSATVQNIRNQQKATAYAQKARKSETTKTSLKEQMELLQQLKSLLDAGALTPEEFEKKKQEVLNS